MVRGHVFSVSLFAAAVFAVRRVIGFEINLVNEIHAEWLKLTEYLMSLTLLVITSFSFSLPFPLAQPLRYL